VIAVAVCMNVVIVVIVAVTAAAVACTTAAIVVLAVVIVIVIERKQMALYAISLVMFSSVLFVNASVYQTAEHIVSHFIPC